ncbi:MAG: IclR family transcriptional regulator [Pseudomonadota bacterium]
MSKSVAGTQSMTRAIDVLQMVTDAPEPPTIGQLLPESGLTRPTLHRILASLVQLNLLEQAHDKTYRPGLRLVSLARKALAENDLRKIARSFLEGLRDVTGETVHLAVPVQEGLVYIDKIESHEMVRMESTIGTIVPIHSTGVGKAYLSTVNEAEAAQLLRDAPRPALTDYTSTDTKEILEKVAKAKRDGFVFDHQENELGISCFGAAIRDETGKGVAAVSISVPQFRLRHDHEFYSRPLMEKVGLISAQLGFIPRPG